MDSSGSRVLVLGAERGLGLALARALDPAGAAIPNAAAVARANAHAEADTHTTALRVWVRRREVFRQAMPASSAEVVEGSMRDVATVRRALHGVSLVYHCIPFRPSKVLGVFYATVVLLDAARAERPHIVYPGSYWAAGLPPAETVVRAGGEKHPRGHLSHELFRLEELLRAAWDSWHVPYTVVRMPDIVGPGLTSPPFGPLWDSVLAHESLETPVRVDVVREMIHVDDAARALIVAGHHATARGTEVVAQGGVVARARDLAASVAAAHGISLAPDVIRRVSGVELIFRALADPDLRALLPLRALYARPVRFDGPELAAWGYTPRVTLSALSRDRGEDIERVSSVDPHPAETSRRTGGS
jgi:nucleoside-diphosphate-sugar epimerase